MKLSEKRSSELYSAIREPIIDLRIHTQNHAPNAEKMDELLFKVEQQIWRNVEKALNLKD